MPTSQLVDLLYRASMGCICAKETVVVEGIAYVVKEHIAEGWERDSYVEMESFLYPSTQQKAVFTEVYLFGQALYTIYY